MTGTAAGNITPSAFVVRATTTDAQYLLATGNSTPIAGISGIGTRYPPYAGLNDGNIAIAGENFRLYQAGRDLEAPLMLGGTVAAGDLLTSDANGHGITTTTAGQFIGAQAMMAGVANQVISVKPMFGPQS
jgi:hypothetical protein